ncbi:hypothetical protein GCM10010458_06090 [Microbacterium luteolum]
MLIEQATFDDVDGLALLKWRDDMDGSSRAESAVEFAADLDTWWRDHRRSHFAFVARSGEHGIVGAAWVALLPRVPRPGQVERLSADIQSVFVLPEHRGHGIGTELVSAAYQHAVSAGAAKVVVNSSVGAVSLYRRLGFDVSPVLLVRDAVD